ncbi:MULTISPECIES: alkaline phosphatase [unclassified Saccharopolyspora]|uniref:alkaline phosphatase D family protein n=1 Tax=unclassified Saccharopolyspora TaxID=2646250 RepID=UPI001CD61964|nr:MULTISPECIES: alkaline phosphatase D family protein [unclassified Saccharopolyspora]MCA1189330.1 alkaline phosphatase D family protein [Saccharopolyspora sp. 6T]MCA1279628.1 alkaline phosphatase D family protein [Saccharopolyspora sp. 7B]
MPDPTTSRSVSRRAVLLGGAAALGGTALAGTALAGPLPLRGAGTGRPLRDPFTLGVASGDPVPDGVVLWTRLAPDPTADDGRGGMPDKVVDVQWEVAENERFSRVVRRGQAQAAPELGHSVHVELEGLRPGAEYYYRFRADGAVSRTGFTRTAPAPGSLDPLTMCFASCAHFGQGHFTAYRRMAEDQPGLILHLGDYQYEYAAEDDDVRRVLGPETRTLANYRQRHAQYKTDADLQLAHATAPWIVVWDDHETENNWAGDVPETPDEHFLDRRAAAFQAYYENMPLRSSAKPVGADMRLYRRLGWGGLATFHMLDTRQYRDDQPCDDAGNVDCAERLEPDRTITGAEQERWLLDGLTTSQARWDVLGQQVFFSRLDNDVDEGVAFSTDSWAGYVANRDRIAAGLAQARNAVVLTGDVHRHWAAEVQAAHEDPDSAVVGTELVTTSITSGGDGDDDPKSAVLAENPHIKFHRNRRGYVRTRFGADELRADFRTVPHVTEPGGAASTARSFTVADGEPRLHEA